MTTSTSSTRTGAQLPRLIRALAATAVAAATLLVAGPAATAHAGTCSTQIHSTISGGTWQVHAAADLNSARTGTVYAGNAITIYEQRMNPGGKVTVSGYGSSAVIDRIDGGWISDLPSSATPYGVYDSRCQDTTPAAQPSQSPPPANSSGRATGTKDTVNRGYSGQCTFGAFSQWYQRAGYYPRLAGNAKDWANSARTYGWTVVADAQVESIVVFQPGVQGADRTWGHVAYVTNVQQTANGRMVTFIEMNGTAGPGNYDTRTVKDVAGMSYILRPY